MVEILHHQPLDLTEGVEPDGLLNVIIMSLHCWVARLGLLKIVVIIISIVVIIIRLHPIDVASNKRTPEILLLPNI